MSKLSKQTKKIAVMGVLAAVTIVISFVTVPMFGLELSFAMVPVAVGAAVYGPLTGAFLGLVFGVVSFLQCFGYSAFGVMIIAVNPLLTFLVCVPTRILAGLVSGLLGKLFKNKASMGKLLAAFSAPVCNTLFFMTALLLAFWDSSVIQGFAQSFGTFNPLLFAVMFVGINGLVEAIAGFLVAFPASVGVSKAISRL